MTSFEHLLFYGTDRYINDCFSQARAHDLPKRKFVFQPGVRPQGRLRQTMRGRKYAR